MLSCDIIFPSSAQNCYLNPLLEFYFSCFYVLSSQTGGKLSRVRDYVSGFFEFLMHQTQSCKEQELGQNWLLWFWWWRSDLVHTGRQGRKTTQRKESFIGYPMENDGKGVLKLSKCPPSTPQKHFPQSPSSLLFLSSSKTIKNWDCLLVLSSKTEAFLSLNWSAVLELRKRCWIQHIFNISGNP